MLYCNSGYFWIDYIYKLNLMVNSLPRRHMTEDVSPRQTDMRDRENDSSEWHHFAIDWFFISTRRDGWWMRTVNAQSNLLIICMASARCSLPSYADSWPIQSRLQIICKLKPNCNVSISIRASEGEARGECGHMMWDVLCCEHCLVDVDAFDV